MNNFTALDIVVLLLIGLGGIAGLMRGFVTEVLSLLAWVAGILAVRFFFAPAKAWLAPHLSSEAAAAILAFALLFVTAYIAFRYVAQLLGSRTRASIVGPLDRLLGLGFGAFKGLIAAAVLFLLLTFGLDLVDRGGPRPAWMQAGRTEPLLELTSKAMVDFVQQTRNGEPLTLPASLGGKPKGDDSKPGKPGETKPGGYTPSDRNALDALLGTSDDKPKQP